ncbi:MAG: signal peptidase II [Firmicutes bacterium]|nr:signal peptidase II [Bacillota bacterium]
MNYALVAGLILICDRLSKFLVMTRMVEGESITLIPSFLYLTYVRNQGAAFGFFQGQVIFLSAVAVLCLLFILTQWRKIMAKGLLVRWGVVISLVGAIGNLIDRVRFGAVIDFIDVLVFPPIFNIADVAIVLGVGLLFWEVLINDRKAS